MWEANVSVAYKLVWERKAAPLAMSTIAKHDTTRGGISHDEKLTRIRAKCTLNYRKLMDIVLKYSLQLRMFYLVK
jgi:hypothetical protein